MTGLSYYLTGGSGSCDDSHSAYWNGITDARDADGHRVAGFGLTSAAGHDYRVASPLSPAPALDSPVAGVPEPASWALFVAGFGLVGFALRRRATAVAA